MRLESIDYIEHKGNPQEWSLQGLTLKQKNLIVGKNASGKTRALNVIHGLAKNLAGLQNAAATGKYSACFSHEGSSYKYTVECQNGQVIQEELKINNDAVLERGLEGKGKIRADKINNGEKIEFQSPVTVFAAASRRDAIQHSYLEPLYTWASSLRYYPFSTSLGKDLVGLVVPNPPVVDDSDSQAVLGVFKEAKKTFGNAFIAALIKDLTEIEYFIDEIDVAAPISIQFAGGFGEPVGLYVKESNLPGKTDQFSMSTGMFRVLSLLIHINYFQLKKAESTILIDDIGEGLDFDRSCRLIDLLRAKADASNIQIILTSNDRFVMNSVPLEEWSVLQRKANHVIVKNHSNSKEIFEDFKFTGLSNFSFLELDVINEQEASD